MAEPASVPAFTNYATVNDNGAPTSPSPSTQVSRYLFGSTGNGLVQAQYNPPNLPIFAQGTVPFMGDYIDIAGQTFIVDANRQWQFNTAGDGSRVPLFHVAWTDNRDVRKPPPGQTWANYASPTLGPNNTVCAEGTNPGSRNQNVYTAPLMPGLVVTAPGNHKTLGEIQRAFVVYAKNATSQGRFYTLTLAPPPAGAFASFTHIDESQLPNPAAVPQIGPLYIPARSSVARSVFIVAPGMPYPQVTVTVQETTPPTGQTAASAIAVLNPDIANPDIANPDIANPDIANPDIANAEVYNPDIANPDIANPDIANPDIANPDIANPDIANPDIANPDIANPDIANPDIANPDIANPDIANPDIANPDIANGTLTDYKVTDITWSVTNKGNTTAAYAFRAKLKRDLPAGSKYQLIVRRVYIAPQANLQNTCGPLLPTIQSQVLVNIPNPDLGNGLAVDFDPNDYQDNASFFLLPSDRGLVTLRVFCKGDTGCPDTAQAEFLAAARVVSQAPNNCPPGVTSGNCSVADYNPDDIYDPGDAAAPTVTLLGGSTITIEAGKAFTDPGATAFDAVDGELAITIAGTVQTDKVGTYTLTYTATDASGNTSSATRTVIVKDTAVPIVNGFTFPAGFDPQTWYSAPEITATVNVAPGGSAVTVVCSDTIEGGTTVNGLSVTVSGDGTHLLACTITDEGGNSTEATAAVKLDSTSPSVTAPSVTVTAEAAGPDGAVVTYGLNASDALSGATLVCTPPSGSSFPVGVTSVSCTATDGAGNTASVEFTVTVRDTTPPVIVLNGEAEVTVPAGSAFADPGATATDLVDGAVAVLVEGTVNTAVPGAYTLTYSATDTALNRGAAIRRVTVVDSAPPVVTVPATFTVEATGSTGAIVTYTASALDTISGSLEASCSPVSGSIFAIGATTVECTATDPAGNTATASFTVTVSDATAPVLTLPAPITAEATGPTGALVTYAASALDAVSGAVTPSCSPASGSTFPLGTTTVSCSATDGTNQTTGSFAVTVRDTIAPLLTVPANISVEETGPAGTPVTYVATASDAVTVGIVPVCAPVSGTTFPLGTTTVACTATDGAGNASSKSFTVTVRDTIAPTVTVSVFPLSIWSPNGAMVPVTVSGSALDGGSGVANVTYSVIDGYKQVQPSGAVTLNPDGSYSFSVSLQASRRGSDKNGRTYTVVVSATDRAGLKTTTSVTIVAVEHNQAG